MKSLIAIKYIFIITRWLPDLVSALYMALGDTDFKWIKLLKINFPFPFTSLSSSLFIPPGTTLFSEQKYPVLCPVCNALKLTVEQYKKRKVKHELFFIYFT